MLSIPKSCETVSIGALLNMLIIKVTVAEYLILLGTPQKVVKL